VFPGRLTDGVDHEVDPLREALTGVEAAVGAEGAWWWPVPLIIGLSYVVPDRHVGLPSPPWRVVIGTMQQIAVVGVALAVLGRAALRQFSAPSARSR